MTLSPVTVKFSLKNLILALLLGVFALGTPAAFAAQALIVADEFPAMEVLAAKLKAEEKIDSKIVKQTEMPADLKPFCAVLVYIHKELAEPAEMAFIQYAKEGGKLILLHHSISSGKRKNKEWFKFLGVELPLGDVAQGGYKYYEGITMDLVNLSPSHFITTNKVTYPKKLDWAGKGKGGVTKDAPAVTLEETEVYLNHVLKGPRTILLGLHYQDAKSGKVYEQARAGWIKPADKGTVVYLMAGHSAKDFENPVYSRIVLNAVVYQPEK